MEPRRKAGIVTIASPWIRRLSRFAEFSTGDIALLEQAVAAARPYVAQEGLAKSGDPTEFVYVILGGLACEFKLLPDGRRQILAYLLAGDMTDARQSLMPTWDHATCVLWPGRVAMLPAETLQRLEAQPNIARAIARYSLLKQAITREWLVNVGHRTAFERVSHLLCEVHDRLEAVGLTRDHSFELPLTQAELGDTLALSAVHVNRTLMELRRLKIVTLQSRHAAIHDMAALRAAAGFDPHYLDLEPSFNTRRLTHE
jgi:CRP-like cAMP-binding protein